MSEPSTNTAEPREASYDPLQPPFCINCGYSLVGLQPECICPECAHPHKASDITIRGWALGARREFSNSRISSTTIFLFAIWVLIWLSMALFYIWIYVPFITILSICCFIGSLIPLFFYTRMMQPTVYAILADNGVLQANMDQPVKPKLIPWGNLYLAKFSKRKRGLYSLKIHSHWKPYFLLDPRKRFVVSLEFRASEETVAAISERIDKKLDQRKPWLPMSRWFMRLLGRKTHPSSRGSSH